MDVISWLLAAVFLVLAVGLGVALISTRANVARANELASERVRTAEEKAQVLLREVEAQKKEMLLQAKEQSHILREEIEAEYRERRSEVQRQERRLQQKEENLDRKLEATERREKTLQNKERELETLQVNEQAPKSTQSALACRGDDAEQAKSVLLIEIETSERTQIAGTAKRGPVKDEADDRIRRFCRWQPQGRHRNTCLKSLFR